MNNKKRDLKSIATMLISQRKQQQVQQSVPKQRPASGEFNTDLNDLRKIICLGKLKVLLKAFQFIKSLKIWWSMADIVCHSPPNFQ